MDAEAQLLCMMGQPVPEPVQPAPRHVRIEEPDAEAATALTTFAPGACPSTKDGPSRVILGLTMGIVPHILCDGWGTASVDGTPTVRVQDRLTDLHTTPMPTRAASLREQVDAHVRATLGCSVTWRADPSGPAADVEEGATFTELLQRRGWIVWWREGATGLSRDVAIGPLAMRRTNMLPFQRRDCLDARFFEPAPRIRAAELRIRATFDRRALIRGVHTLSGFGADDGSWYASHIVHDLEPGVYEQTVSLVRVGA